MTKYTIYILMLFAGLNTFAQTNRNRVLYFGQRDSIAVSDYSSIRTFDLSGGKVEYVENTLLSRAKSIFGEDNIISYLPLNDTTAVANDVIHNNDAGYLGTYTQSVIGVFGESGANFAGTGYLNLYQSLEPEIDTTEGFISFYLAANHDSVWDLSSFPLAIAGGSNDRILMSTNTTGWMQCAYKAGGTDKYQRIDRLAGTGYYNISFRWSKSLDACDLFVNGIKQKNFLGTSLGTWSTGVSVLSTYCNLMAGSAGGSKFNGRACNVLTLDYAPTDAQIKQYVNPTGMIMFEGDSRTTLRNWICKSTNAASASEGDTTLAFDGYGIYNAAVAGSLTATVISRATTVNTFIIPGKRNILVVWVGVNDSPEVAPADAYNNLKTYCIAARSAGWNKIVICTDIDSQSDMIWHNTNWAAYNALIASDHSFADAVVDLGAIAELQDATNTTYFEADKLHLTATGSNVVGVAVGEVLKTIW